MTKVAKVERKIEYFPCVTEVKEFNDAKGIIGGYANFINNIDFGDDRSRPGAFYKTLKESYSRKDIQHLDYLWPYLWSHDFSQIPPGGVIDAEEDRQGLYAKTQFNLDVESGRTLYSSFRGGFVKKQSIGYKAIRYEYVKDEETKRTIRDLLEIQVMEISAVVFPMNDMAQVDTVKNGRRNFYMTGKLPTKQDTPALTLDIHSKDYAESYMQTNQSDWISDLWNLWYPLRNEILTAFQTGDTIEKDVQSALAQFAPAVLAYMQHGIELDMTSCLQPGDDGDSGSMPMMMSSDDNPETKDVKLLSAASHAKMTKAIGGMEGHIKEMKSELSRQRANALQGYQVYSGNEPPEQKEDDEKPEEELDDAAMLNKLRASVDDLASTLQFENAFKGI